MATETMKVRDHTYFEQLEPYRQELLAHCYRMLGSVHDAEDAVQESLVRAWRSLDRFEGRSSSRTWLYSIATNVCLRMIERRPARVLPLDYGPASDPHRGMEPPLTETTWIEPYPDVQLGLPAWQAGPDARYEQREAIELAFIAALQHLPPRQRAVLILRDVLGFAGTEVAATLDTSPASVYSLLQRAHATLETRLPDRSQQMTLRALGDAQLRDVVDRYVDAWTRADIEALVGLLTDDVTLAMPPRPSWYRGIDAVLQILRGPLDGDARWRLIPTQINAQPGFAVYRRDDRTGVHVPSGLGVLSIRGDRICAIDSFHDASAVQRHGYPATV